MTTRLQPLLPGASFAEGRPATLGVVGGGQLGRMFIHAAQAMGFRTVVLDPDAISPAGQIAHHHIEAEYDDADGIAALARLCDAVTTEFENIPATTLDALAAAQVRVAPAGNAVSVAQDRAVEKAHLAAVASRSGVGPGAHAVLRAGRALSAEHASLFPAILKTVRLGYDGKGQIGVSRLEELPNAWASLHQVDCVLEQRLDLRQECSVIIARGRDGHCVHLPVQLNWHHQGILATTEVAPGLIATALTEQAIAAAETIAESLQYVGVLCVEFFVINDGSTHGALVVNEIAPRPHNSGHYSVDACDVSQFELQVRAMAELPLLQPRLHSAAVMLNLLGDIWFDKDTPCVPAWDRVLALPGVHLHLYGKIEARSGRKMGHITITAADIASARATAQTVSAILGLPQA
jgi:5-(carboxyamino)imidazole ribonucleotide synthase